MLEFAWCYVGTVDDSVAQPLKPRQHGFFNCGFGDADTHSKQVSYFRPYSKM